MSSYERDDAYLPLEAPDILPVLSLITFAGSLAARPLVRLIPRQFWSYQFGAVAPILVAGALAILGLLLGLIGLSRARRRSLARLGLILNGVVLGLTLLAALAIFWILRR